MNPKPTLDDLLRDKLGLFPSGRYISNNRCLRLNAFIDAAKGKLDELPTEVLEFCRSCGNTRESLTLANQVAAQLLQYGTPEKKLAGYRIVESLADISDLSKVHLAQAKMSGDGTKVDVNGAHRLVREIVDGPRSEYVPYARFLLGDLHYFRRIRGANDDVALHQYLAAASEGCADAAFTLGCWYEGRMRHRGESNLPLAAMYYRLAAGWGDIRAQTNLAILEALGAFPCAIRSRALVNLQRAADDGDEKAEWALRRFREEEGLASAPD
jgi:TPR repeat protein